MQQQIKNKFQSFSLQNNDKILQLKIISFNVQLSKFKNENDYENQAKYLNDSNADIIFLQEGKVNMNKFMKNYASIGRIGFAGKTFIFIKKEFEPVLHESFMTSGTIASLVETKFGKFIAGSIHFAGRNGYEKVKKYQFDQLENWIKNNSLNSLPIIMGGSTNMKGEKYIENSIFNDPCTNIKFTWPNKDIKINEIKQTLVSNDNYYKADTLILSKSSCNNYDTINTVDSDHLALLAVCEISLADMNIHFDNNIKNVNSMLEPQNLKQIFSMRKKMRI